MRRTGAGGRVPLARGRRPRRRGRARRSGSAARTIAAASALGSRGGDEQAVDPVGDGLGQAADRGGHHRHPERERLHHRDGEALVARREHEQVGPGDDALRVGPVPEEPEAVAQGEALVLGPDLRLERALPAAAKRTGAPASTTSRAAARRSG